MEACLKCGYTGHKETFAVCEKCGAVQEKVRASLAEKIQAGVVACDELSSLCAKEIKRAEDLKSFAGKNDHMNYDWKRQCLDPLHEIEEALEKTRSQIGQLKGHASGFVVNYEVSGKLAKFGEYIKKFREEIEQNSLRLDELWSSARNATINHATGIPREFDPPKGIPLKHQMIEEVEAVIHEKRYPFMLVIAGFYKVMGYLVAILTVVIVVLVFFEGGPLAPQVMTGALVVGPIICITLLAIAESIKVGIDIEQNTRAAREYQRCLFMKGISEQ